MHCINHQSESASFSSSLLFTHFPHLKKQNKKKSSKTDKLRVYQQGAKRTEVADQTAAILIEVALADLHHTLTLKHTAHPAHSLELLWNGL